MIIHSYYIEYEQIDRYGGNIYGDEVVPATSRNDAINYYREAYPRRKVVDCVPYNLQKKQRPNAWAIDKLLQDNGFDLEGRKLVFNTLTACTFVDCTDID